jgi:hypothetical protein
MMPLSQNDLDKYLNWIKEGRSFSEVREDLTKQGLSADEINRAILDIDEAAIQHASTDSLLLRLDWTKIGLLTMALGVLCYVILVKILHYTQSLTATVVFLAAGGTMIFVGYKAKSSKGGSKKRGKRKFNIKSNQ